VSDGVRFARGFIADARGPAPRALFRAMTPVCGRWRREWSAPEGVDVRGIRSGRHDTVHDQEPTMANIELHLTLPRDARYVPVLRNVAGTLMQSLDVPQDSVDDVALALSEACGNVIRHAAGTDQYAVILTVATSSCEIVVCDLGPGFDRTTMDAAQRGDITEVDGAEDGRGLRLLQALMDDLQFVRDDDTTTVRLLKRWDAVGLG
jgi:serine/threonine-protein kinase RsbW